MSKTQPATKQKLSEQSKQSPIKGGKKQSLKNIPQQNVLEAMKGEIDFLAMFTQSEIHYMFENYDTIVFQRGMVLAKEKQVMDYVGVILTGGAIAEKSKTKYKKNSFIGHSVSIFGLESHKHPQTVTAESDGILLAIRVEILINPLLKHEMEHSIKAKILNFMSQETLCCLKGEKHFGTAVSAEFQVLDEKMAHKFQQSSKILSSLIDSIPELKQRQKFFEEFPLYCTKEKTLIASRHSRPYFLLLLKGEIIVKYGLGLKKQTRIIQSNNFYNAEGFIFDHNQFSNLYCGTSEAVFLLVDKTRLVNNFRIGTVSGLMKNCLEYIQKNNEYAWGDLVLKAEDGSGLQKKEIWSPFRKSFNIQEIPNKKESMRATNKQQPANNKKKQSINTFQTLYQTYSNQPKNKLRSKQTTNLTEYKDSDKQRVHTSTIIKTEYSIDEKVTSSGSNEKLKKLEAQVLSLKEQNLTLTSTIKRLMLDLLESQSRLKMSEVFKQINNLKRFKDKEDNGQAGSSKTEGKSVTLKQAFEIHLKNKKLELLVAKCAYKWLSITRDNKTKRENQSTASLLSNNLQKSSQGVFSV